MPPATSADPAPHRGAWPGFSFSRSGHLLLAACTLLAACAALPTPYQPLGEVGGYEETRLAPDIFRVSFQGNAETREVDVIDFAFLRCAQLTRAAGYTHFVVLQQAATGQINAVPRAGFGLGYQMGLGYGPGPGFGGAMWGNPVPGYDYFLSHRLAVLMIKMLGAEQGQREQAAFDADFLIRSLQAKHEHGQKRGS